MNANTEVDLSDLHQAIVADISAQFPELKTVAFYREETDREPLTAEQLPACLLELADWEVVEDEDPGTEQLAVDATFEAHLMLSFRTPAAKLSIRRLAAALSAFLRKRRWTDPGNPAKKLPTGAARPLGAAPDDFNPAVDRLEVWTVRWAQRIHLGATVWVDEQLPPLTVLANWAPEIGPEHEPDYKPVTDGQLPAV